MHPKLGSFLLLAGSALADLASIQNVLDTINAGLLALDQAVVGLPATQSALTTVGAAAVAVLANATQIVDQSAPLTLDEALSLSASTAALRQNSNLTINDFIAQRGFFDSNNLTGLVLQALAEDKVASIALGNSLLSKVSSLSQIPGGQEMANATVVELNAIYDRGIALFSNQSLATGVPPAPMLSSPPSPATITPVSLPVPEPANIESTTGTLNADGSCNCAVQCPAGSFGMDVMMLMTGVAGTTGTSGAPQLQMLPGSSGMGSGMPGLKPLGG